MNNKEPFYFNVAWSVLRVGFLQETDPSDFEVMYTVEILPPYTNYPKKIVNTIEKKLSYFIREREVTCLKETLDEFMKSCTKYNYRILKVDNPIKTIFL